MRKARLVCVILLALMLCACGRQQPMVAEPAAVFMDDEAVLSEADALLESGNARQALFVYLDALETNPKSVDARVGLARSLFAMEEMTAGYSYLADAIAMDGARVELYEMMVETGRESGEFWMLEQAILLASDNGHLQFEEMRPAPPTVSHPGGEYGERLQVTLAASEEDAQVVYTTNGSMPSYRSVHYVEPIALYKGKTVVKAACLKDGVLSEPITILYELDYPSLPIAFTDPQFEAMVRLELGKPFGDILDTECETVTSLYSGQLPSDSPRMASLEDVRHFPALQSLSIYNAKYGTAAEMYPVIALDITPLLQQTKLNYLNMTECGLTSIDWVRNMPQLTNLVVNRNEITDISVIRQLPNLRRFQISDNPIADLSPIQENDQWLTLDISDMGLSDISWLAGMTELETLFLDNNDLTDISPLSGLPKLRFLYMGNNKIRDISTLEDLVDLEYLTLYGNPISDLSVLDKLPNLQNKNDLRSAYYPTE